MKRSSLVPVGVGPLCGETVLLPSWSLGAAHSAGTGGRRDTQTVSTVPSTLQYRYYRYNNAILGRKGTLMATPPTLLPPYSALYPTTRSPRVRSLRPITDPHAVLNRDVEASGMDGLERLAASRASAKTRDLVIIATNEHNVEVAANCVANLAAVGIDYYILLANKQSVCQRVQGRLACVWSSLLEPYRQRLRDANAGGMQMLWLVRQIYAGRLAILGFNPFVHCGCLQDGDISTGLLGPDCCRRGCGRCD